MCVFQYAAGFLSLCSFPGWALLLDVAGAALIVRSQPVKRNLGPVLRAVLMEAHGVAGEHCDDVVPGAGSQTCLACERDDLPLLVHPRITGV